MSPTKRLTRSASDTVKAQEFASRQRQSQAAKARKSGVGRELASLEIEIVGETQQTTGSGRAVSRRYDLRGGKKDPLAPKPARVTKPKSTGRKKTAEKKVYLGPGYRPGYQQGVREGTADDGRECLICAETLGRSVLSLDLVPESGERLLT